MEEAGVGKPTFDSLLATEFARKYGTTNKLGLSRRIYVMERLLSREADSGTIRETLLWCFHDVVEAAFLLSKQGLLANPSGSKVGEYSLPDGLYS